MPDFRPHIEGPKRAGGDGVPEVYCADEQDAEPVDVARWRSLALDALLHEGVRGACELSLFFIDETSIAELNQEHMGKVGPTDVLSFPMDGLDVMVESQGPGALTRGPSRPHPDVDDVPTMLGDVLVCPSVAKKQFGTHAGTYDDEIALLVVHGVLHVLGFDHDDEANTADMRAREMSILERHHWNGPAPAGFRQGHDE
ncbi:MAG: hypothetical protein RJA47_634 [Actinomycetota bacterium]